MTTMSTISVLLTGRRVKVSLRKELTPFIVRHLYPSVIETAKGDDIIELLAGW